MKRNYLIDAIGILLIFFSTLSMLAITKYGYPEYFFWASNHIPILIGFAILFRSSFLLTAEISLIVVAELGWSLDFLSKLLFNFHIFGSTAYMFNPTYPAPLYWEGMQHLIILPLSLTALFMIKKSEPNAWKLALTHGLIIVIISFLISSSFNLNCIHKSCISWIPTFSFYSLLFPLIYFAFCVLPVNYLFVKIIGTKKH